MLAGVAVLVVLRIAWYLSVAVGLPFIPARDDQAGRQHVVEEIAGGRLVAPGFVGFDSVQLSPLDADLAVGGEVEVDRDARGTLTVTFWTQAGILGQIAGYSFTSDGHTPTEFSDSDMVPKPIGGGWFELS